MFKEMMPYSVRRVFLHRGVWLVGGWRKAGFPGEKAKLWLGWYEDALNGIITQKVRR